MTTYKSPQELIHALRTMGYPKTVGQFSRDASRADLSNAAGFCCLGVYAEECGIRYSHDDTLFRFDPLKDPDSPILPEDHWLGTPINRVMWDDSIDVRMLQEFLADVNDQTTDFREVIRVLEDFVAGERTFDSDDYQQQDD